MDPARAARLRRLAALAALLVVIGAGLGVHALLPDTAGSDVAGDALYAVAVYAAVALIAPRLRSGAVAVITAGWCVAIELFQLTGIPLSAGAAFAPAMFVLGTVFDPRDLIVYPAAVVAVWAVDALVRRALVRRQR